jgi:probable rRNA maturation factor
LKIRLKNTNLLKEKIDRGKIGKLIDEIIRREDKRLGEIVIVFLGDEEILRINREFLKHDYFTDIITFDYNRKRNVSGDLCIGIDSVTRNTEQYKTLYEYELVRVIIHGILHLIGYDDQNNESKRQMKAKENFYLKLFYIVEDE